MWIIFPVAAVVAAAVLPLISAAFPVSLRAMGVLGVALGLGACGYGVNWVSTNSKQLAEVSNRIGVTCEVLESTLKHTDANNEIEAVLRVRWKANGRVYRSSGRGVFFATNGDNKKLKWLQAEYAPGKTFTCFYAPNVPSWVYPYKQSEIEFLETREYAAWSMLLTGLFFAIYSVFLYRKAPPNAPFVETGRLKHDAGIYLILAGFIVLPNADKLGSLAAWSIIGALWGLGGFLFIRALKREDRVFSKVEAWLTDVEPWVSPTGSEEPGSFDPYEDQKVLGQRDGVSVGLALHTRGLHGFVALDDWPETLTVCRRSSDSEPGVQVTDSEFSEAVFVDGPERDWRPFLVPDVRSALVVLLAEDENRLDSEEGKYTFNVEPPDANRIGHLMDSAVRVAQQFQRMNSYGGRQVLLDSVSQEHDGELKAANFKWLCADDGPFKSKAIALAARDPEPAVQLVVADSEGDLEAIQRIADNDDLTLPIRLRAWRTVLALTPEQQPKVEAALIKLMLRLDEPLALVQVVELLSDVGGVPALQALGEEAHRIPESACAAARATIRARLPAIDGGELTLTDDGGELALVASDAEGALSITSEADDTND